MSDPVPGPFLQEDLREGRALPGQGRAPGERRLPGLEDPEQCQGPFTGINPCCHNRDSAILGVDRRVQVDVGIR
jgi:hypothetical protein